MSLPYAFRQEAEKRKPFLKGKFKTELHGMSPPWCKGAGHHTHILPEHLFNWQYHPENTFAPCSPEQGANHVILLYHANFPAARRAASISWFIRAAAAPIISAASDSDTAVLP